jgi:hypothetical protein
MNAPAPSRRRYSIVVVPEVHPPDILNREILPVLVVISAVAGVTAGPVIVRLLHGIPSVPVMLYVPAPKIIRAQFGALKIVLCRVLVLMPLFKLMVGPPHPTGPETGSGVGGSGVGVGPEDGASTTTEVRAVAEE